MSKANISIYGVDRSSRREYSWRRLICQWQDCGLVFSVAVDPRPSHAAAKSHRGVGCDSRGLRKQTLMKTDGSWMAYGPGLAVGDALYCSQELRSCKADRMSSGIPAVRHQSWLSL